ncbi:hypothetical protein H1R20_g14825, partial [Candolleomyces eurysporus]
MPSVERTMSDIVLNPPFTQAPLTDLVFVSKVTGLPICHPSDFWLKHPGWIDHVAQPPHYYVSNKEIEEALGIWGPLTGIQQEPRPVQAEPQPCSTGSPLNCNYELDQVMAQISPTPVPAADAITALQPSEGEVGVGSFVGSMDELYVIWAVFNHPPPLIPGTKQPKKLVSTVKVFMVNINTSNHVDAHSLSHAFSPGTVSGPAFKFYWTGSSRGKTNAASILTNEDFNINKAALFRKKQKPEVSMEFSATELEAFRIQEPAVQAIANAPASLDKNQELAYGTHVPQVLSFNTSLQMHGLYILELKKKWVCQQHLGEHGKVGHCYLSSDRKHIQLNLYRLQAWAAAWAAGDATKHEPPNVEAFDGERAAIAPVKPQG